jgi:fibronectin type 3 domain-containing protein
LTADTTYYYKVTAVDTSGNESQPSVQASAKTSEGSGDTTPPAVPTGLTATAVSSSSINLDWADNTDSDLAGYKVYRSTTSDFTPGVAGRLK